MRAWRAAAASLVVGAVLTVLGLAIVGLADLDAPGSTAVTLLLAGIAVVTLAYAVRVVRMLRAARPAPEALVRRGSFGVQVLGEIADDLIVPLVFAVFLDDRSLWFAMVLLLAFGLRRLIDGALIVRWERRHDTRVLRTGGFFRPDRLILAH
jgi:hypothetical protein